MFYLPTWFAAGAVVWPVLLYIVFHAMPTAFSDDDGADSGNMTMTNTTATDCTASLDDLALHFIEKKCFDNLACGDRKEVSDFMEELLEPLRVEAIFFTQCVVVVSYMLLMQGASSRGVCWCGGIEGGGGGG